MDSIKLPPSVAPINDAQHVEDPIKAQERAQGADRMREMSKHAPNWLVGLAPLAMGVLMGDLGVGATVAGDTLMKSADHAMKDEDAIWAAERKLASGEDGPKRGTFQLKPMEMPDGSMEYSSFDTRNAEIRDTGRLTGFSPRVGVNPVTKELSRESRNTNTGSRAVNPHEGNTVKQQENLVKFRDTVVGDKQFQSYRKSQASSGQALTMLQANNSIGDQAIKTIMPRIMGEVGNLTAAEQNAYSGSPLFSRKFDALKERLAVSGGFTEDDRADLVEVAKVMQSFSRAKMSELADNYLKSEGNIRGTDSSGAIDPILNTSTVNPKKVIKNIKKSAPTYGKAKKVQQPSKKEGFVDIFEISPSGEYNFLKTIRGR